ncbi:MAG TPA: DUF2680 domain-containing protein [Patescibacteria group bacterium]|jgi:hypothetical protein|nr:DUF2680 domain-containing protein [Patescibacteria group bacterium]
MKKTFLALTLVIILVVAFALSVYAESDTTATPQWFKDMITWKKDQITQAVKAGQLTEEDAKLYFDRIDQMEKFHLENGFTNMMGTGFGGCGGTAFGRSDFQNTNYGFGPGMMRGRF